MRPFTLANRAKSKCSLYRDALGDEREHEGKAAQTFVDQTSKPA